MVPSSSVMYMALTKDIQSPVGTDKEVAILAAVYDVSSLPMISRGPAREIMRFSARSVALVLPQRKMIKASTNNGFEYCVFGLKEDNGVTAILIANSSYPIRCANYYLREMLKLISAVHPSRLDVTTDVVSTKEDGGVVNLSTLLKKSQDPEEEDQLLKLAKDIDEVRNMAYENLEKIIERGRSLEDVLKKSEDLSAASKMFLREAKKTNCRFCAVM